MLVLALALAVSSTESRHLAVLEFKNKVEGPERKTLDATYFADQVRAAAVGALPALNVITRESLLVLLKASGKRIEDCEGECEVDTGRRIGADLVISGELLKLGSLFKLSMRLHETSDGRLLSGATAQGKSAEALDAALPAAVQTLLSPLKAAAPPPAAAEKPPAAVDEPTVPATPQLPMSAYTSAEAGFSAWVPTAWQEGNHVLAQAEAPAAGNDLFQVGSASFGSDDPGHFFLVRRYGRYKPYRGGDNMTQMYSGPQDFLSQRLIGYGDKLDDGDPRAKPVQWAGKVGLFVRARYARPPPPEWASSGRSAAATAFLITISGVKYWPAHVDRVYPGEHAYFVLEAKEKDSFYVLNYFSPPGEQGRYWREFKQMVETFAPR